MSTHNLFISERSFIVKYLLMTSIIHITNSTFSKVKSYFLFSGRSLKFDQSCETAVSNISIIG